jgi:hypothetical protein
VRLGDPQRNWPWTLRLYAAIALAWAAAYLGFNHSYVSHHAAWIACWDAFGLATLAALVVWRQRWAWWLVLIGQVWSLLYLVFGAVSHPFWAAVELVLLALLLSPPTRRYLFAEGRPVREVRLQRDWVSPLIFSGLLTLLLAVPARHRAVESVGARVVGWIVFWLLLAVVFRVVARRLPKKPIKHRGAWAASLLLGGALTLLVAVSGHRHGAHAGVVAWITVWLLFSAGIRVIVGIVQLAIRLTQGREDPPGADPGG